MVHDVLSRFAVQVCASVCSCVAALFVGARHASAILVSLGRILGTVGAFGLTNVGNLALGTFLAAVPFDDLFGVALESCTHRCARVALEAASAILAAQVVRSFVLVSLAVDAFSLVLRWYLAHTTCNAVMVAEDIVWAASEGGARGFSGITLGIGSTREALRVVFTAIGVLGAIVTTVLLGVDFLAGCALGAGVANKVLIFRTDDGRA